MKKFNVLKVVLLNRTQEYDRMQTDYRTLTEEVQRKRRILQDLEKEGKNKVRKHAEQHSRLEQETNLTREEYYQMKDELDKLAYTLRFSIEEELKIYEALLNSLDRQRTAPRPLAVESNVSRLSKTSIMRTADVDDSAKYGIAQGMLGQNQTSTMTTTTKTTRRTAQDVDRQQQISVRRNRDEKDLSELDEKYLQSRIRITRRYLG